MEDKGFSIVEHQSDDSLLLEKEENRNIRVRGEILLGADANNDSPVINAAELGPSGPGKTVDDIDVFKKIGLDPNTLFGEAPLKDHEGKCCSGITIAMLFRNMFSRKATSCREYCKMSMLGFILMGVLWIIAIGVIFIGVNDKY